MGGRTRSVGCTFFTANAGLALCAALVVFVLGKKTLNRCHDSWKVPRELLANSIYFGVKWTSCKQKFDSKHWGPVMKNVKLKIQLKPLNTLLPRYCSMRDETRAGRPITRSTPKYAQSSPLSYPKVDFLIVARQRLRCRTSFISHFPFTFTSHQA
jgi:hypothetical protein